MKNVLIVIMLVVIPVNCFAGNPHDAINKYVSSLSAKPFPTLSMYQGISYSGYENEELQMEQRVCTEMRLDYGECVEFINKRWMNADKSISFYLSSVAEALGYATVCEIYSITSDGIVNAKVGEHLVQFKYYERCPVYDTEAVFVEKIDGRPVMEVVGKRS